MLAARGGGNVKSTGQAGEGAPLRLGDESRGLDDGNALTLHALGLAVGPRMVGFGQAVFDPVLATDTVEDVAETSGGWARAVLRQIGKGHAVVC